MSKAQHVSQFRESLDAKGVTSQRVDVDAFETALRDVIDEPAVGTPLSIEALDLPSFGVDCSPTADAVRAAKTGVTGIKFGIAAHGTVVVESAAAGDEALSLYPDKHVAVIQASDIVPDLATAVDELGDFINSERGSAVLTTGASATGDMGALVEGVHGPREVHVIIVEDQ